MKLHARNTQQRLTHISSTMKLRLQVTLAVFFIFSGSALAQKSAKSSPNYQCTNKAGKVGIGLGRISLENEYSSFLGKHVREGEYIIFRYENRGVEYWFRAENCRKLSSQKS